MLPIVVIGLVRVGLLPLKKQNYVLQKLQLQMNYKILNFHIKKFYVIDMCLYILFLFDFLLIFLFLI